jgi:uncharacterized protein (TIGR02001 family)
MAASELNRRYRRLGSALAFSVACALPVGAEDAMAVDDGAAVNTVPAFNGDVDIYSDYIARGLSYNHDRIALQARVEYDSRLGPYAGLAFNNNTVIADKQSIEVDPYLGFTARYRDMSIDLGAFCWLFPSSRLAVSHNQYDTLESYVGVVYKTVGVKYWYELTNYFGLNGDSAAPNYGLLPQGSSRGSHYLETNLTQPLPRGFTLILHAGRQYIRSYTQLNYTDWRVGLEAALGHGFIVGVGRTDTNADSALYTDSRGLNLAQAKWVGYLKWVFP